MAPSLRALLVGPATNRERWYLELLVAVPIFVLVFVAYAIGVFEVAGGVVFIPGDAALVGLVAAVVVGFLGRGLLLAWLVAYAAILGSSADHYFLGITHRPFIDRLVFFLGPDGLVAQALMALVIGTVAWLLGSLLRWAIGTVLDRTLATDPKAP